MHTNVILRLEQLALHITVTPARPADLTLPKIFGALGEGFIHVHHIVPIGKMGKQYEIDPIADLIPFAQIATR